MPDVSHLQFSIRIHAPVGRVWDAMLGAETYRDWTAVFAEGSYYEGDWSAGSMMRFLTPAGDGMVGEVAANRRHAFVSIRFRGHIAGGRAVLDDAAAGEAASAFENYTFRAVADGTELVIDQDIATAYAQYMRDTWPGALTRLKALCEADAR